MPVSLHDQYPTSGKCSWIMSSSAHFILKNNYISKLQKFVKINLNIVNDIIKHEN
jgi:hypothetical protein